MSLIVAYSGKNYQLWCSDGLVINPANSFHHMKSDAVVKIVRHPNQLILYGWAGNKYDAEFVISNQINRSWLSSTESLLEEFAYDCARINSESKIYALKHNQFYCQTGFIVGGYFDSKSAIYIIIPDGAIHIRNHYAIIGHGSYLAYQVLKACRKSLDLSINESYELIIKVFKEVSSNGYFVNNILFPFALSVNSFLDLTPITLLYKNSFEMAIKLHHKELKSFAERID